MGIPFIVLNSLSAIREALVRRPVANATAGRLRFGTESELYKGGISMNRFSIQVPFNSWMRKWRKITHTRMNS